MGVRSVCLKALNKSLIVELISSKTSKRINRESLWSTGRLDLENEISNARSATTDQGPGQTLQCIAVHLNNDRINISSKTHEYLLNNGLYPCGLMYMNCCFIFLVSPKRCGGN